MNKIVLTDKDIIDVTNWGLQYEDLVKRSYACCPMRLIKVIYQPDPNIVKEARGKAINNFTHEITYVREGDTLEASYIEHPNTRFKTYFKYVPETNAWDIDGYKMDRKWAQAVKKDEKGFAQFLANNLHIYLMIMALMIFHNIYDKPDEASSTRKSPKESPKSPKKKSQKSSKNKESITYILKTGPSGEPRRKRKGSHAKPNGQFSVRGHYRHYRDGKIVWVHEYEKGKGKETKDRTYKVNLSVS